MLGLKESVFNYMYTESLGKKVPTSLSEVANTFHRLLLPGYYYIFNLGYCISSFLIGSLNLGYQLIYHSDLIWKMPVSVAL